MPSKAGVYNIDVEKGSDFSLTLFYKNSLGTPIDLTGCSVKGDVKAEADLAATPSTSFTCSIPSPQTDGKIIISLSKIQTSALAGVGPNYKYKKQYAYDIVITLQSGKVKRVLNGNLNVLPGVTSVE